jgi:hypothetical protein
MSRKLDERVAIAVGNAFVVRAPPLLRCAAKDKLGIGFFVTSRRRS